MTQVVKCAVITDVNIYVDFVILMYFIEILQLQVDLILLRCSHGSCQGQASEMG